MKDTIRKTLVFLTALIAVLAMTGCGSKTTIDLTQYVQVNVSGADGYGYASADVDDIGLEALLLSDDESDADSWVKLDMLLRISYEIDKKDHLSNGDKVSVTVTYPDGLAEALDVRIGEALQVYSAPVRRYKKRGCYQKLHDFVYGDVQDRVFILYGLRRTGKTTLIRQILAEMSDADLSKAAFIQATARNNLAQLNQDLKQLERQGFKYIFIDEVTLMEDFIEGAALLSDIFATCGMKIVLSGKDSLGFLFTAYNELYDRCIRLHTTHIPYREFEEILGIRGIDEYIRYGGTMSLGGVHYNETSTFASKKSADEYVDSAIARNIQHSLECYDNQGHFRHLAELYEQKCELTRHRFGPITGKYVLYRGADMVMENEITYRNVENYLLDLV